MNTTIRTTNALSFHPVQNYIEIYLHFACFFFSSCFYTSHSHSVSLTIHTSEPQPTAQQNLSFHVHVLSSKRERKKTTENILLYSFSFSQRALFQFISLFHLKTFSDLLYVHLHTHSRLLKWRFSCACPCVLSKNTTHVLSVFTATPSKVAAADAVCWYCFDKYNKRMNVNTHFVTDLSRALFLSNAILEYNIRWYGMQIGDVCFRVTVMASLLHVFVNAKYVLDIFSTTLYFFLRRRSSSVHTSLSLCFYCIHSVLEILK